MFFKKLLASVSIAILASSSAVAIPWPSSLKHTTHRVRDLTADLRLITFHPESTFEVCTILRDLIFQLTGTLLDFWFWHRSPSCEARTRQPRGCCCLVCGVSPWFEVWRCRLQVWILRRGGTARFRESTDCEFLRSNLYRSKKK